MNEAKGSGDDNLFDPADTSLQATTSEDVIGGQKVAAGNNISESVEKSFFEVKTEFNKDEKREFRQSLLNADEKQTREIIEKRIAFLEESCNKVEEIVPSQSKQDPHHGYIGSNTRVCFQTRGVGFGFSSSYRLKDTGYLYEAVSFLQDKKDKINNGSDLFDEMESFFNSYFGIPDTSAGDRRVELIEKSIDWKAPTDEELFASFKNVDLSIFKGQHVAICAEHAAMAQNILSFFGYETYYTNGTVSINGKPQGHVFNIVVDNAGQKHIADFSVTSTMEEYRGNYWNIPTLCQIQDFDAFLQGTRVKTSTYKGYIDEDGKVSRNKVCDVEYDIMVRGD
jgi:hypothetical protein